MKLINSDCIAAMTEMHSNSVDSIVTDPPYELGFMGKSWDSSGVAFNVEVWKEALRILKPGGHLLAFSGSRTYHRMAVAIEDAGFEIRDQIMWVYGSGFPKSRNLKDEWQGWGTALKPAHEPIILARKPVIGTVANNVLTYGVGGLNIDGSRVAHLSEADRASSTPQGKVTSNKMAGAAPDIDDAGRVEVERPDTSLGRWPANFIHDGSDEVVALFPDSNAPKQYDKKKAGWLTPGSIHETNELQSKEYGDSGSAARFFYCAKASKRDRNEGALNNHPTVKPTSLMRYLVRLVTPASGIVLDPFMGSGSTGKACVCEGFNFIGIDQSAEYVEIAQARINFAVQELIQEQLGG
jgi:site-specific DNA-methyltransferase (adenine-specific)